MIERVKGRRVERANRLRERGQATTSIVLVFSLLLLGLGFVYTFRVAKIQDQAGGLTTAADAAALAGAQSIVSDIPGHLVAAMNSGKPLAGNLGLPAAQEFASRNGAQIVYYRYFPAEDRVDVRVRSTTVLETGKQEEATASARVGVSIAACSLPKAPSPTPKPAPSATPTASPAPPPPPPPTSYDGMATCGDLKLPVKVSTTTGDVTLKISASALKAMFKPALTK